MKKNELLSLAGYFLLSLMAFIYLQLYVLPKQQHKETEMAQAEAGKPATLKARFGMPAQPDPVPAFTLQNDLLQLVWNAGAVMPSKALLQGYHDMKGSKIVLFDQQHAQLLVRLHGQEQTYHLTDVVWNIVQGVDEAGNKWVTFTSRKASHPFVYRFLLPKDSYQLHCTVTPTQPGIQFAPEMVWYHKLSSLEEKHESSVRYCYINGCDDAQKYAYLGPNLKKEQTIQQEQSIWIAAKNRFFSQVLIFDKPNQVHCVAGPITPAKQVAPTAALEHEGFMESVTTARSADLQEKYHFSLYLGPNDTAQLTGITPGLVQLHYLGPRFIRTINRSVILPAFDYLKELTGSQVLALLLLLLLIKLLLLYHAYRSYIDKIRKDSLAPEVAKLKVIHADDAQKLQLAEQKLYQRAGVSPFSARSFLFGFISAPFFISMFHFIPNTLSFRHASWLWFRDISTYDVGISLPFHIPFLGTYISLAALFMVLAPILLQLLKSWSQGKALKQEEKIGFYISLPMLFFFNSYPVAFCLYRIFTTLIDAIFSSIFSLTIDPEPYIRETFEKLQAVPQGNKSRPRTLARLEKRKKKY
jgi:YidC/Oxa1 family membrane protein insertase